MLVIIKVSDGYIGKSLDFFFYFYVFENFLNTS